MRIVPLLLVACSSPPSRPARPMEHPVATNPELSPALARLNWLLGDWHEAGRDVHWVAAAGAIYGIALSETFEITIIDDADGAGKPDGLLRLYAIDGHHQLELREGSTGRLFDNARDAPTTFFSSDGRTTRGFRRPEATLEEEIRSEDDPLLDHSLELTTHVAAPELERADRAFSDATVAHGVDGWVAAFDEHGAMMRRGQRIEGHEQIAEAMKPLLSSGKLSWAPIASGKRGDTGYTVGKAEFRGDKPDDHWRSSYVTIWRQTAGGWKVLFDTGRPVNE
jgi:ketosteroid isomerase-like protein